MANLRINGFTHQVDLPDDTPLLWVIREHLKMTGTKYGCGIAQCGACTVHVNGQAQRSCVTPIGSVDGEIITTIEGLDKNDQHPVQQAWIAEQVPQCGYCQSGQIMQAASLLATNPDPTDAEITTAMNGNLCRCMTYNRIRKAIKRASSDMVAKGATRTSQKVEVV